jgi:hypothetical protein
MREHVEQFAGRIADVESPHAPGLIGDRVDDLAALAFAFAYTLSTSSTSIEMPGTGVPEPPSLATLIWVTAFSPDASVTIQPWSITTSSPNRSA